MDKGLTNLISQLDKGLNRGLKQGVVGGAGHNRYTLNIDGLLAEVSVLQVEGNEQLNQPWHYTITFTCLNKHLSVASFLNQNAHLIFNPAIPNNLSGFANKGLKALNSLSSKNKSEIILPNIFNFIRTGQYNMKFLLTDNDDNPMVFTPYKILYGESVYATGTTDSNGYTSTVYSETAIPLHVEIDIDRLGENNVGSSDKLD